MVSKTTLAPLKAYHCSEYQVQQVLWLHSHIFPSQMKRHWSIVPAPSLVARKYVEYNFDLGVYKQSQHDKWMSYFFLSCLLFIYYFLTKRSFPKKREKNTKGTSCLLNRILLEAKIEIATKRRIVEEKLQFPELNRTSLNSSETEAHET